MPYDVFISYAHVDDEPLPYIERGWVTTFVQGLKTTLARELGRKDKFSLWMDYEQLRGNHAISPEIRRVLAESRTLVLFLSKAYLASRWCIEELESFASRAADGQPARCIYAVYVSPVESEPDALRDLVKYQLWVEDAPGFRTLGDPQPDPTEREYYHQLRALARDLAQALSEPDKPTRSPGIEEVFVNGGEQDVALMRATAERLQAAGVPYTLPVIAIDGFDSERADPAEVTRDLHDNLERCDAMLLIHDQAPPIQIRQHVIEYVKASAARADKRPRALAVCQRDPAHQSLGLSTERFNIDILPVQQPFAECCADCFVKALRE